MNTIIVDNWEVSIGKLWGYNRHAWTLQSSQVRNKSGKKLPTWDMNKVKEQSVGESPWTDVQQRILDYTRKMLGCLGKKRCPCSLLYL